MASAMIMGTTTTAFAANGRPEDSDTAIVTITDLSGNPTVTLYQIADVEYGPGGVEFVDYEWADGITEGEDITPEAPTATEINAIAQGILNSDVIPFGTPMTTQKAGDTVFDLIV